MPLAHSILTHGPLKDLIYGGKGVGSQGDGSVQLLCKDQNAVMKVMAADFSQFTLLPLTVRATDDMDDSESPPPSEAAVADDEEEEESSSSPKMGKTSTGAPREQAFFETHRQLKVQEEKDEKARISAMSPELRAKWESEREEKRMHEEKHLAHLNRLGKSSGFSSQAKSGGDRKKGGPGRKSIKTPATT
jgi:hypothetical protein